MIPKRLGEEHADAIFELLTMENASGISAADGAASTPLHLLAAAGFHSAAAISILKRLLSARPEVAGQKDAAGRTPFHLLCASTPHTTHSLKAFDVILALLAEAAEPPAEAPAADGAVALHLLCGSGRHTAASLEMFRRLLALSPDSLVRKDRAGARPLHRLCASSGHTRHSHELYEQITSQVRAQRVARHGEAAGTEAGLGGESDPTNDSALPLLLLAGAGQPSLHSLAIFETLLEQYPQAVAAGGGPMAELPIHALCKAQHSSISVIMAEKLLAAFPQSVTAPTDDGLTPLHMVFETESLSDASVKICRTILAALEEAHRQAGAVSDDDWMVPLMLLCNEKPMNEHSAAVTELLIESHIHEAHSLAQDRGETGAEAAARLRALPLGFICRSEFHSQHVVTVAKHLVAEHPNWLMARGDGGMMALHSLCRCAGLFSPPPFPALSLATARSPSACPLQAH
jgi:hypothetical protein